MKGLNWLLVAFVILMCMVLATGQNKKHQVIRIFLTAFSMLQYHVPNTGLDFAYQGQLSFHPCRRVCRPLANIRDMPRSDSYEYQPLRIPLVSIFSVLVHS